MIQFRPALWMSVFMIPALLILVGLGTWQIQRLQWKNQLISSLHAGQVAPAIDLPVSKLGLAWIKVKTSGSFVEPLQVRRLFTTHDGSAGYRHLTLFETTDGRLIFVDRGFVPLGAQPVSPPPGTLELSGFLHPTGQKGWLTPAPEPDKNIWYWRDMTAMFPAGMSRESFIATYVLDRQSVSDSTGWPQAIGAPPDPANNHLDYALTWFGLAFALIGVYLVWHVKNNRLQFGRSRP